ncbi:MAG: hypothetical protein NZZ41_05185 [Candidatus Dojkabacteria bacterium]|nr:hypothetical protein [Candidatus Dojkabacteria bacterium]
MNISKSSSNLIKQQVILFISAILLFVMLGTIVFFTQNVQTSSNKTNNNEVKLTDVDIYKDQNNQFLEIIKSDIKNQFLEILSNRQDYNNDISVNEILNTDSVYSENFDFSNNNFYLSLIPKDYVILSSKKYVNSNINNVYIQFVVRNTSIDYVKDFFRSNFQTFGWYITRDDLILGLHIIDAVQNQSTIEISILDFTNDLDINGVMVLLSHRY